MLAYVPFNAINSAQPGLTGALRPTGAALGATTFPIPTFCWGDAGAGIPRGALVNAVPKDRLGRPRTESSPPGAYVR